MYLNISKNVFRVDLGDIYFNERIATDKLVRFERVYIVRPKIEVKSSFTVKKASDCYR